MTKKEFVTLAATIKNFYPKDNLLPTQEALGCWYAALGDLDFETAKAAVIRHVQTSKYAPTVAEIRGQAVKATAAEEGLDWSVAWRKVKKSISEYGLYNEREALEALDEHTREAVKRMDWRSICLSDNEEVCRAQFRQIYEQVTRRAREELCLSDSLRKIGGSKELLPEGK